MNFRSLRKKMNSTRPADMFYWPSKVLKIGMIIFFSIAAFFTVINLLILSVGHSVPGTVVDFERITTTTSGNSKRMSRTSTVYRPVFGYTYEGMDGRLIAGWVDDGDYHKGDQAEILVNPYNPNHFALNDFWELWTLPLIFGVIGVILMGMKNVINKIRNAFQGFFKMTNSQNSITFFNLNK